MIHDLSHGQVSQDLPDPDSLASVEALLDDAGAIHLKDPRHVYSCKVARSHRNLTGWLRRFMKQLLIGCSNSACFTRSCRSYRQRTLQASFRPYTTLSARMIASFLVNQDCPEDHLCPFLLVTQDEAIAMTDGRKAGRQESASEPYQPQSSCKEVSTHCQENTTNLTRLNALSLENRDSVVSELVWENNGSIDQVTVQPAISDPLTDSAADFIRSTVDIAAGDNSFAEKKDPKSLTQNLFDTATMRKVFQETDPVLQFSHKISPESVRSLPFLSSQNVTLVLKMIVQEFREEFKYHRLLRSMGRKLALSPSTMQTPTRAGYLRLVTFLEQSIYYVCTSFDALLQSFHGGSSIDVSLPRSSVAEGFLEIVDTLALLQSVDLNSILLSSLQIIAEAIDVTKSFAQADSAGSRDISRSFRSPIQVPTDMVLEDRKMAHIIKIIFGALIGTVTIHSITPAMMEVLSTLRFARSGAPPTTIDASAEYLQVIRLVQDVFEDASSVSLIIRLTTAIASRLCLVRIHACRTLGHAEADVDSTRATFLQDVIRDIIASADRSSIRDPQNDMRPLLGSMSIVNQNSEHAIEGLSGRLTFLVLVEWLRTVLLKEWDGKPQVLRSGSVGGALEILRLLYNECQHQELDISMTAFCMLYVVEELDPMKTAVEWASTASDDDDYSVHLLSYPFLFPPATLVSYFRAINYDAMKKAYDTTRVQTALLMRMTFPDPANKLGEIRQLERVRANIENYLVLDIKRGRILGDAMDQLWRRKPFELQKPLKIRLGMTQGEEGIDHGGVQQEFFRLAIAEALDAEYGLFTTDPITRMSWFQPLSLEPLYKFELIGMLFSLALYNGLTLPCTMPLAFYRRILEDRSDTGASDRIADIQDGWPELARGLQSLQDWAEGDVQDVFMRTYTFSVNVFGSTVNYDMDPNQKTQGADHRQAKQDSRRRTRRAPTCDEQYEAKLKETHSNTSYSEMSRDLSHVIRHCEEAMSAPNLVGNGSTAETDLENDMLHATERGLHSPIASTRMVTNANRDQYIRDYIHYLTNTSVRPQFSAFMDGFWRCLNKKSMRLLTPSTLKSLIEGHDNINTRELYSITKYEGGFSRMHSTILDFWDVVHHWAEEEGDEGQTKVRKLLEFVTASDRLPIDGVHRIAFVIQKNGEGDARLPTSLTCFGRLLLPEYSGRDALQRGIERAIEEAKGFGQP